MLNILTSNEMSKVEFITTEEAFTLVGCKRTYFYRKYISQLTLYKDANGHKNFFDKKEVLELAKKLSKEQKSKPSDIRIVRNATTNTN